MSLAEANGRVAVGVLLSGLGLDGTAGVMALKEQGGLLVCERDERGSGGEMQLLTDPAGLADFVLAAEEIVPRVGQYMRHLRESSARRDEQAAEQGIADQISRIAAVLRQRTGHDFHGYKHGTFLRRIARRMQVNAIDAVERYIDFLREDADEVHHLFQDLLIGVTHFFRSGRPRAVSEMQLGRQAERVVERHAPAYLLVDPRFEVLSFSGRTGRFLEPAAGSANLNVLNLAHRDLRIDLRAALQRAALDKASVKIDRIALDGNEDGERRRVDLIVELLPGDKPPGYIGLSRETGSGAANDDDTWVDTAGLRDEHVQRLEGELRLTRERFQATIEDSRARTKNLSLQMRNTDRSTRS